MTLEIPTNYVRAYYEGPGPEGSRNGNWTIGLKADNAYILDGWFVVWYDVDGRL